MKMLERVKSSIGLNFFKTVLFNFRVFPFRTAIYLPVVFYGRVLMVMGNCKCVKINGKPRFGMLRVGRNYSLTYGIVGGHPEVTYFHIDGTVVLNNGNNEFANGCKIYIWEGAQLSLNGNVYLSNLSKINCSNSIVIGKNSRISWECQLFDTNMHYMIDIDGNIRNNKGVIIIGDNCWIGNRCTIQKGAKLPNDMIVASNSVVNKDFTEQPSGILAGLPAKLIKTGEKRLFDFKTEKLLNIYFQENPLVTTINIKDIL